jgi:archaellum component FlaC
VTFFSRAFTSPDLRHISEQLDRIEAHLKGNSTAMKTFDEDVTDLKTAVTANTDAFNRLATLKGQEEAIIKDQAQQIADLKAANPALDLSALEENISQLKATNSQASQILPPPPAAVPA